MKKIHNKWLIVLLALAMVLTVASSASAAAPDSIKTGFYVYDASKVGQEYTYYSLSYILDPDNFNNFLTYKDDFANDDDFIWVDSEEQFVSIADWDNGPAPITDIKADLGSAIYYDIELGRPLNLALSAQASVSNPTKNGFNLSLSRAVAGLAVADLELRDSTNALVGGLGISNPSGDNKSFQITGTLTPGESYTLTISKADFYFGEAIDIEVPTEIINLAAEPVTAISKTGFTLNLSAPLTGLTTADFLLQDQYGNNVSITGVSSSDGGNTYDFTATLEGEESYTLSCPGDKYELSAQVSFTVPPTQVATSIHDVTVSDLVVKLDPGVDNIPSANFYLRDANNNRLLSMIISTSGSPTTDYKIGAFPYLVAGSQYSIEIHMKGYDFGDAKGVMADQTDVTMTVANPSTTGFSVTMNPAVPGLNAGNFNLKNEQGNNIPFAVSTSDGGATYIFKSDIIAGSPYTIAATKNGFNFGTAKNVLAPVEMIGVGAANGKIYVYLNGILDTLPAPAEFTITRSIDGVLQANPVPTNVSQNTTTRILTLDVSTISANEKDQVITGSVSYGGVSKNYSFTIPSSVIYVASQITDIDDPAQDATTLTLPSTPAGFSVAIYSSSNEEVIKTDGTIIPPLVDTTVAIVLQVTKDADSTTANTTSINVVVPGSPTAVANSITDIDDPAPGATTLTLPGIPAQYTLAIKTSSNDTVIDLDGNITLPWEGTSVDITLEVTKTSNGDTALTGTFTVDVPEAPAVTAINSADTAAAMQAALGNTWLGLDLAGFNALNTADKATVAQGVINARPVDGYRSKAVLQAALDNAVDNVQDLNALNAAIAELTSVLKGSNTSLDAVTTDLNLVSSVTVTVGGVDVDVEITSWNSSNPAVVGNDGTVNRPSYHEENEEVVLTATLTKGALEQTKEFTVIVLKQELVAQPIANPSEGKVEVGTEITLTSATPGASIYYTLDGTIPTTESTLYSDDNKPVIDQALTLKAIAVKEGMTTSEVSTFVYTVPITVTFELQTITIPTYTLRILVTEVTNLPNAAKWGIEGNTLKRDIYNNTSPTLFAPYDQKAPESYKITIYDEQDAPIAEVDIGPLPEGASEKTTYTKELTLIP